MKRLEKKATGWVTSLPICCMTALTAVSEASVTSWVGAFKTGNASIVVCANCCFIATKDAEAISFHSKFFRLCL